MHFDLFGTKYVINTMNQVQYELELHGHTSKIYLRHIIDKDIDRCTHEPNTYMFLFCPQFVYFNIPGKKQLVPNTYFVYQLEQFDKTNSPHIMNYHVLQILKNAKHVFDYSKVNIQYYITNKIPVPISNVTHFIPPIVEHQLYSNLDEQTKTIDVLFCGCLSKRRMIFFNILKQYNINVQFYNNVFGKDNIRLISNAKILLNLRYSDSKILEYCRLHESLGSRLTYIMSEYPDNDQDEIDFYGERVSFFKLSDIFKVIYTIKEILDLFETKKNKDFIDDIEKIKNQIREKNIQFWNNIK